MVRLKILLSQNNIAVLPWSISTISCSHITYLTSFDTAYPSSQSDTTTRLCCLCNTLYVFLHKSHFHILFATHLPRDHNIPCAHTHIRMDHVNRLIPNQSLGRWGIEIWLQSRAVVHQASRAPKFSWRNQTRYRTKIRFQFSGLCFGEHIFNVNLNEQK